MKTLITGGCSFSECRSPWISTWPKHLAAALPDYQHTSTAMGSQGNGLISRQVIYQVTKALKQTSADNILVGIMWSGPDRHDFYVQPSTEVFASNGWMENPTRFVKNSPGKWQILNHHWTTDYDKLYYTNFHSYHGALIYTLEHILRTQWFLKSHGIKYFMSTYTGEVLPDIAKTHPDMQHLYNLINTSVFLPVVGEYEWCRDYSGLEFPVPNDPHPGTEQHRLFVEQVVLPFLKERNSI